MTELNHWTGRVAVTAALIASAGLFGCDSSDETLPPAPESYELFTPDESASGARMWLEVSREEDVVTAALWAAELGDLFGWSAHIDYDDALLSTVDVALDESLLGGAEQAVHVAMPRAGDIAFGATLREPSLAEVAIDAPTQLGTTRFNVAVADASRLGLLRVMVRRADRSYVPVAALGGDLDTRGGVQ